MLFLGDTFIINPSVDIRLFLDNFKDDTIVLNLECSLETGYIQDKLGPSLSANINELIEMCGIADVFCLANNHISDSGKSGLFRTIDVLDRLSKRYCGINNHEYVDTYENGCTVRIYNFTDDFYGNLSHLTGLDSIHSLELNLEEADFFVAVVHMGIEGTEFISQPMRDLANTLASLGFHCIFFHHAHVPSGYDMIEGAHVFYGLGNFIFDYNGPSKGLAVKVAFSKERLIVEAFHTYYIDNQLTFRSSTLPKTAQIINDDDSLNYFKVHLAYHYAMAFNGAIYLLSVPNLIRYIYYSVFRSSKKRNFSQKLKYQFKNNTTYNYFYEWYDTNHRRNR